MGEIGSIQYYKSVKYKLYVQLSKYTKVEHDIEIKAQ